MQLPVNSIRELKVKKKSLAKFHEELLALEKKIITDFRVKSMTIGGLVELLSRSCSLPPFLLPFFDMPLFDSRTSFAFASRENYRRPEPEQNHFASHGTLHAHHDGGTQAGDCDSH